MSAAGKRRYPVAARLVMRAAAGGLALALALAPGASAVGALAPSTTTTTLTSTTTPTTATADRGSSSAEPRIRLVSQTSWVDAGAAFVALLKVTGVSDPDTADINVSVRSRVTSRSQFALTMQGRNLGGTIDSTSGPLSKLPPAIGGAVSVSLAPDKIGVTRTGVYPVQISLRRHGTGRVLDKLTTYLVFVAAGNDAPRLGLTWILAVHHDPAIQPSGLRRIADPSGLAALADVLRTPTYASLPLVFAPTPETLEGLIAPGTPNGRSIVEDLRADVRGHQTIARPYVPVPIVSLVGDGLGDEIAAQRTRGLDADTSVLQQRPDSRTWLVDEPLDDDGLSRVHDLGVNRIVVPDQYLAPLREQKVTLAQPFLLGGRPGRPLEAAAADSGLAAHFQNSGDQVLAAHQFLADLAVIWLDSPGTTRGVVLSTPRRWKPSRDFLETAFAGLVQSPLVQVKSLDQLFGTVAKATVSRRETVVRSLAPPKNVASLPTAEIARDRGRVDALGSSLAAGSPNYDELDRRLLVAESADLSTRRRRDYLNGLADAVSGTIHEVVVPRARTLTLTSRQAEVPLTFLNRSDVTMRVRVRLKSEKLDFPDGDVRVIDLPPRSHTERFLLTSRTSGAFPLKITVETPEGSLILATTQFTIRSTAASEAGLILSIGALAFLLVWWARHAHTARRARRLVPAPATAES